MKNGERIKPNQQKTLEALAQPDTRLRGEWLANGGFEYTLYEGNTWRVVDEASTTELHARGFIKPRKRSRYAFEYELTARGWEAVRPTTQPTVTTAQLMGNR